MQVVLKMKNNTNTHSSTNLCGVQGYRSVHALESEGEERYIVKWSPQMECCNAEEEEEVEEPSQIG